MSKSLFKKQLIPLYFLFPLLLVLTALLFSSNRDAKAFDTLTDTIFKEELSGNTLNLHYTLAFPENFGIPHEAAVLPCYSSDSKETAEQILQEYLDELSKINAAKLDEEAQYTYTLLNSYLSHTKEGNLFPYYEEPLSPASGMQSQLPILLAEYTFRTIQDVEDYLTLLDQTDEYFASLLTFEQEKKEAGLLLSDTSLQKVREQCYAILSNEELEAGTHFLQTTFAERLQGLLSQNLLTKEAAEKYLTQNNRLLSTVMLPAYESLADGIFLLMGDGTSTPTGLCSLPEGKDYYAWLVRKNTGSALTVESLKALLYPQFDSVYRELKAELTSRSDAVEIWMKTFEQNSFPLHSPEEILADLQKRMAADFPAFPGGGSGIGSLSAIGFGASGFRADANPGLSVKQVSPSLEKYTAPAFYLTPPLDDLTNNVIYINQKSTPEGLDLYTTLAHEGYPGHLYQSVYSQLTMRDKNDSPVRQILWYGGYQEGWAVYVEFMAYDYAAALAAEQGNEDAAFAYTLEKHNRNVQLCLYALLDVAIHYDCASYEQIHKVLSSFGIANPEITRNVYDYVAEEPANYLKYYVGYLEILRLKEAAKEKWGNTYTDLKFHTFFLNHGPSDFTTLNDALAQSLP